MSEENLSWFANNIFEVIEALSLVSEKDRVAKQCEGLLLALCTSRDKLRERFAGRRSLVQRWNAKQGFGRSFNTGMIWSGTRIEPESSLDQVWKSFPSSSSPSKIAESTSTSMQTIRASSTSSFSSQTHSSAPKSSLTGVNWNSPSGGTSGNPSSRSTAQHSPPVNFSDDGSSSLGAGAIPNSPVNLGNTQRATPPTQMLHTSATAGSGVVPSHRTPSSSGQVSSAPSESFTSLAGASWPLLDETQWSDLLLQLDNDLDTFANQGPNPIAAVPSIT